MIFIAYKNDKYFEIVEEIAHLFPSKYVEQLYQLLYHGPVEDGDIICKSYRGSLIDMGIAVRVCYKGEQGYTASKYIGFSIFKTLKAICPNKVKEFINNKL